MPPLSLEAELDAFMKTRIEQDPAYEALARRGFKNLTPDEFNRVVWHVVGVHREALLWLARQINNLPAGK